MRWVVNVREDRCRSGDGLGERSYDGVSSRTATAGSH
jgi:hypothetical protein